MIITSQAKTESLSEAFDKLSLRESLNSNLESILEIVKNRYSDIGRISVAMYDEHNDSLKSYLSSAGINEPLSHLEISLDNFQEIHCLKKTSSSRIIRDFESEPENAIANKLIKEGYLSSYIVPIFDNKKFLGIISFSSFNKSRFAHYRTRAQIDLAAKLVAFLTISELYAIQGLQGTAKTLKDVAALRDNETGEHLERMSRYSRHIARHLAQSHGLDDEFIEDLYLCAPLHDIGKIAIPDKILLKPGALTDDEFSEMQKHTIYGKEIIDKALINLQIAGKPFSKLLSNIVFFHHENWDGTGYPSKLVGKDIPLEARIIRVADVYDALTSERPYKKAWSQSEALDYLQVESGKLFDSHCVDAAAACAGVFKKIKAEFSDKPYE